MNECKATQGVSVAMLGIPQFADDFDYHVTCCCIGIVTVLSLER